MDRALSLLVKFAALDRLTSPLRRMGVGSKAVGREIAATRKEIVTLERSAAKIGGYRDLEGQIAKTADRLAYARERVNRLTVAIGEAKGPTGALNAQLLVAAKSVERLELASGKQTEQLATLGRELGDAGVDVKRMAEAEEHLGRATADANGRLEQQRAAYARIQARNGRVEAANRLGERMRAGGTRSLALGIVTGAPLVAAAGEARDFQSSMVDIGLKTDMASDKVKALGDRLSTLAPKVAQMPEAIAQGFDTLAGLGVKAPDAEALMEPLGKVATAWKGDVDDLARAAYANLNNLQVPIGATTRALDRMAAAGKAGGFEIKDMAQYFPALTGQLQALHSTGLPAVEELSAALQVSFQDTGQADTAANNIQNLLLKLNAKETIDNFKKMGVDLPAALKRAHEQGKGPLTAIADLTNKVLKGDLSKVSRLFGDQQALAGVQSLISHRTTFETIRTAERGSDGLNEQSFSRRMQDDPAAQQAQAASSTRVATLKIGAIVDPAVTAAKVELGQIAQGFNGLAEAHPALAKGMVLTAGAGAALATTLGGLGIASGYVWPQIVKGAGALRFLTTGFLRLGAAMLMNPWVLAIAGIIALGIAIYTHWGAISGFFSRSWSKIRGIFGAGMSWLRGLAGQFLQIGANIGRGLVDGIGSMFGALKAKIVGLGKSAVGWFKGVLGIHSPSRVFAELGGFMMAGLDRGLDRASKAPLDRIRATGRALALGLVAGAPIAAAAQDRPALVVRPSAPSNAGAPGRVIQFTGPITIQIHQQPGENGDALAQRMRREFEDRARVEVDRRAASYADLDE